MTNQNKVVRCEIKSRKQQGETVYEGTIYIPNTTGTKLAQVRGQKTTYTSLKAVRQAAEAFAGRWGLTLEYEEPATATRAAPKARRATAPVAASNT